MELMLDTINLEQIMFYHDCLTISGVTSNPSIVKKEGAVPFFLHMKQIREIIGRDKSLHIQVVGETFEDMKKDAQKILLNVDQDVFIKVPVTHDGLKLIKELKSQGKNVTATAIYSTFQGLMAINVGADYIAPYYNRMEDLGIDSAEVIASLSHHIHLTNSTTNILAASFKNTAQLNTAIKQGAQAVTVGPDILKSGLETASVQKAVHDFSKDWQTTYHQDFI